jgi:hypothetical protein
MGFRSVRAVGTALRGVIAWWPATRFGANLFAPLRTFAGADASKRDRLHEAGIETALIDPGKPWQNGADESSISSSATSS